MKILSINVNNFGGVNNKPLLCNYKLYDKRPDFDSWGRAVSAWRVRHNTSILKNVASIEKLMQNFDVIFLHEVDTNCPSWKKLLAETRAAYTWKPANGIDASIYNRGKKSITCVFVRKNIDFEYSDENILQNQRSVSIQVQDVHIIGLHMSYNIEDWNKLILKFESLKKEKCLIIGDLNVFDVGTDRRQKLDELLEEGAIDIWLKQGGENNIPTANTNKRIDYALSTDALYQTGIYQSILDDIRIQKATDHAAIAIEYNN